jgi:hypothetical protein
MAETEGIAEEGNGTRVKIGLTQCTHSFASRTLWIDSYHLPVRQFKAYSCKRHMKVIQKPKTDTNQKNRTK